jgi:hypothetical protein
MPHASRIISGVRLRYWPGQRYVLALPGARAPPCNGGVPALLAILLLSAASGTPAASRLPASRAAVAPPVTACRAVTLQNVRQALGRRIAKAGEETGPLESSCDYAAGEARVTVTVQRLEKPLALRSEIAQLLADIPGSKLRNAPDLRAAAFFLDIAGAGTQLHLIRGSDYVMISILGFGEPAGVSPAALSLMRAALARLR